VVHVNAVNLEIRVGVRLRSVDNLLDGDGTQSLVTATTLQRVSVLSCCTSSSRKCLPSPSCHRESPGCQRASRWSCSLRRRRRHRRSKGCRRLLSATRSDASAHSLFCVCDEEMERGSSEEWREEGDQSSCFVIKSTCGARHFDDATRPASWHPGREHVTSSQPRVTRSLFDTPM